MRAGLLALALAAAGGCASTNGAERVSDADLGRLRPEEMGPVDAARKFRASATDEKARATLRLQEARRELMLAKADEQAAQADIERASAQQRIADDSREPAELEKARQLKEQADLQRQAAEAHLDFASKQIEAREAALDAAEKQVALADARLEQARLRALQDARVPAATKYDAGAMQDRLNEAQKSFDESLEQARELDGQASASRRTWEDLRLRMQAHGGAVRTG